MLVALSGIQSARTQMNVAANNIANMFSPGYTAQRVENSAHPDQGGVESRVRDSGQPVELEREAVEMIEAEHYMKANGLVIKAKSDMVGTFLDIMA